MIRSLHNLLKTFDLSSGEGALRGSIIPNFLCNHVNITDSNTTVVPYQYTLLAACDRTLSTLELGRNPISKHLIRPEHRN